MLSTLGHVIFIIILFLTVSIMHIEIVGSKYHFITMMIVEMINYKIIQFHT